MLNKKEVEQTRLFLATVTGLARDLLDEVATYEAELQENKAQQCAESVARYQRRKRLANKRRFSSK
jgi:hypothetical protein